MRSLVPFGANLSLSAQILVAGFDAPTCPIENKLS